MLPKPLLGQPDEALTAAVERLRGGLADVLADADWSKDGGRASAIAALDAIFAFAEEVDELRGQELTPLRVLHLMLCGLDQGAKPRMFEPRGVRRGRRASGMDRVKRGIAAAGMELLRDAGLGREDAARRVAEEFRQARITLKGNQRNEEKWKIVAHWRDQANATRAADHAEVAKVVHRKAIDAIQAEQWPWPPDEGDVDRAALVLLSWLRRLLARDAL